MLLDHNTVWRSQDEALKPKNMELTVKHGVATIMLRVCWCVFYSNFGGIIRPPKSSASLRLNSSEMQLIWRQYHWLEGQNII